MITTTIPTASSSQPSQTSPRSERIVANIHPSHSEPYMEILESLDLDSLETDIPVDMTPWTMKNRTPIQVKPTFCPQDVADPFDTVTWTRRTAVIRGDGGTTFFEQKDCEFPENWSQLAVNVVTSKYFFGEVGTAEREKSIRALIHRVSRTIADWGVADGVFASQKDGETFYRELTWLLLHQHASFNSPVWFNVGLYQQYQIRGSKCGWHWNEAVGEATQPENPYEFPQGSACFIQSVADDMEAIMELARSEALLFKFGSGTGTDLSTLRSCREKLSGGGKPSGPLSFMRVYDQIAAVVKSGGKTRRAAKMQSMKIGHPDVVDFIDCKFREEEKARILIRHGLSSDDAYSSVMYQNANLSVRVSDEFMQAVKSGGKWQTRWVTNPNMVADEYEAKDVFQKIATTAWSCGDPGLQYDTTINKYHTCPNDGPINASNPCSEYMFLDDSACNLASVNLMKFRNETGLFDHTRFVRACRIMFIAQDILVDRASYPIKKIAENSHKYRPLGLGYSNLGSLLMSMGLPYDSKESRGLCSVLTALMHGAAYRTSAELAAACGPFVAFAKNKQPMLRVIETHWDAVNKISNCPKYLKTAARELWDEVTELGKKYGYRNAQATVLAPTGTISFMMDCDTTGIEPDIALVKYKQLAGGGNLRIVNGTVPLALQTLGYNDEDIASITKFIEENGSIADAPDFLSEHLPVFDCAFPIQGSTRCIPWEAHLRMMSAAQPFLSGAISKTVNMPSTATVEDVASAYMMGWELGLKAVAIYRDGSKSAQPLSTSKTSSTSSQSAANETGELATADGNLDDSHGDNTEVEGTTSPRRRRRESPAPRRERLPDTRQSVTHKFDVNGHEGYITVGLYPDGRPGELFLTMAKEGSTIGGLMDCFGTAISMSLQYGVPLRVYIEKFSHTRFEPMGHTKNPDIRVAKSLVDYIFRWLGLTFAPQYLPNATHPSGTLKGKGSVFAPTGDDSELSSAELTPTATSTATSTQTATQTLAAPLLGVKRESYRMEVTATEVVEREMTLAEREEETMQAGDLYASFQTDAPACDACGSITVRSGNCYLCYNCGKSLGCS